MCKTWRQHPARAQQTTGIFISQKVFFDSKREHIVCIDFTAEEGTEVEVETKEF